MLNHRELSSFGNLLSEGFFADNVVRSFRTSHSLKPEERELLRDVLEFFRRSEKGREQVTTGKLYDDAPDAIGAYNRVLAIMERVDANAEDEQGIIDFVSVMTKETQSALDSGELVTGKFEQTLNFFRLLRIWTLDESARNFSWEVKKFRIPERLG